MRRIILSMLLLLAGATTYAQVGINKEVPQATLDINAKKEKTVSDKVEGLLIPRVSKEKAHKMGENGDLQESTMIYVNDLSTSFSVPSATEARVEDITGNGYYFWNGTKWVRQTGKDGEEWVYNPTDQRIELKRSGKGDFHNYVYYDNTTGQYINTDTFDNIEVGVITVSGKEVSEVIGTKSLSEIMKAKDISFNLSTNIHSDNNVKAMSEKKMNIVSGDNSSTTFYNDKNSLYVTSDNSNNYTSLYSNNSSVILNGTGNVNNATAYAGSIGIRNQQNVPGSAIGVLGEVSISGRGNQNIISGVSGRMFYYSKEGANIKRSMIGNFTSYMPYKDNSLIKQYIGVATNLVNASQNTGDGEFMVGIENKVIQGGKTKYTDMYGIRNTLSIGSVSATKPDNLYGLYIGDATGAELKNYSIYTNAGDIRFGDLADSSASGERLVIADNDGVLATSATSLSDLESLWANDVPNTRVYLKETSAGVAREDSGSNRNSVTISDTGAITAKGFIGYNGASIFPDYVFEKYYKGYSDIKADYNFHNLTSVETFIKKNGHLPGYQSAQEIAKEGLIDIGATQLTNIEKIEELYLHTIEQEKKIEAKDAKIAELEARLERLEKLINK